jgi:hypothetical protein
MLRQFYHLTALSGRSTPSLVPEMKKQEIFTSK